MTVRVAFPAGSATAYDVRIGRGLHAELPVILADRCPASRYAVVTDSTVERLYARRIADAAGAELVSFPAGEARKTRETWAAVTDRLLELRFSRDGAVIAVGGGVVGDLAGFVAATYHRGIPYVQVPTTVLAMIDASIGGKTGVDTPFGKNLVGAFHHPRVVVDDLDTLASLPAGEFSAGLAEAVKHGVVADGAYFDWIESAADLIAKRDDAALERLVARSVEIKASIVTEDHADAGRRAVLNFGHTVGHAIEAASGFAMLHGHAVAAGMVHEARLAEIVGAAPSGLAERVKALLVRFGLPTERPAGASVEQLIGLMRGDKKARAGDLRFVLPTGVGQMVSDERGGWTVSAPASAVRQALAVNQ